MKFANSHFLSQVELADMECNTVLETVLHILNVISSIYLPISLFLSVSWLGGGLGLNSLAMASSSL